ncbi:uncharacterized protein LOC121376383 [Gigantopelta aegis]|uniref:uncharacterized protein LOC121376383 n=1 Tax=Gigantopelta aegis TaxID=1735272 RepID=UPI001B88CDAA|nr:uncharacterized protein LOC121376383 [Gigantopelta aegis]
MKFHYVHGSAVTLSSDKQHATRTDTHFCNGIVFGHQPISIGKKYCIELSCIIAWSGAIRIGLTTINPVTLNQDDIPKYAFPDLMRKEGYWVRSLNESLVSPGARLTFYVTSAGQLQLFVDGDHKGALLANLPTNQPLWLILDIYGNTNGAKFVKPDDAPKEITARGPKAIEAYEKSCQSGTQSVYRTRLMLVGKDRVGKTSLKKSLTGQCQIASDERTDGIDLSASCSYNLNNRSSWKLAIKGYSTEKEETEDDKKNLGILGGSDGIEEEYHKALATNIVQELLFQKRQVESATKSPSPVKSTSAASIDGRKLKPQDKRKSSITKVLNHNVVENVTIPPDLMSDIPIRVVELVQEMLNNAGGTTKSHSDDQENTNRCHNAGGTTKSHSDDQENTNRCHNVVLNIWDFAGQAVYYTTHQVFLTSRAVYVIVFKLNDDLTKNDEECKIQTDHEEDLSVLEYMDFWMRSIHSHAAENTRNSVDNTKLSPPIFIVGTHRSSLHPDVRTQNELVEAKFSELRKFITGKPYAQHIVTPFFAVENNYELGEDPQIDRLREEIEKVSHGEPYMGEQIPIKWLKFEQEIVQLADEGTNFATYDQMSEIAHNHDIISLDEVQTMLEFYHALGVVIHYGALSTPSSVLQDTVVLKPQWLIDMFKRIITTDEPHDKWNLLSDKWDELLETGVLEEPLIDKLWEDALGQKHLLLKLMETFDLISERLPPQGLTKSYYVPMCLRKCQDKRRLYSPFENDAVFYLDFSGFLPDGLFFRILTRTVRWSQDNGGRDLHLFRRVARFYLDSDHDFVLELAPRCYQRIKVTIMFVGDGNDRMTVTDTTTRKSPTPAACARVRYFLECTLSDLRSLWMKRIAYKTCVVCPCWKECTLHSQSGCAEESCIHFLDIDECITSKVVCCEHRRVKTDTIKNWFPVPKLDFQQPIVPPLCLQEAGGNIEKNVPDLPIWMKGAAKLLNGGDENQDWTSLAKLMGYKQTQIDRINEDLNPSLALLTDWILSSGNTNLSVDLLCVYLEQLSRDDIVDVIQRAKETGIAPAQVFISYQWDIQDNVQSLRDHLERAGFSCWMDIGQMGAGDQLNVKIDEGIRKSKAVIACLSPKYVVSHHCNRELSLADILQKPVIPVMFENVMWPPLGGMAVIFSQLAYINMKGVGGHGGTGIHADLEDKYNEIIQRLSLHVTPVYTPCIDTTVAKLMKETDEVSWSFVDNSMESGSDTELDLAPPAQWDMTTPSLHSVMRNTPGAHVHIVEPVHVTKCAVCIIL